MKIKVFNIRERLINDYDFINNIDLHPIMVSVIGSQNYNLDDEESNLQTIGVVDEDIHDFIFELDNDGKNTLKLVSWKNFCKRYKQGNFNYYEMLHNRREYLLADCNGRMKISKLADLYDKNKMSIYLCDSILKDCSLVINHYPAKLENYSHGYNSKKLYYVHLYSKFLLKLYNNEHCFSFAFNDYEEIETMKIIKRQKMYSIDEVSEYIEKTKELVLDIKSKINDRRKEE